MLPPPFTCYWPEESPVTQPCHLVEVWRFNSPLVNRNLPYNYHPHLGRRLPCNISHLFLPAEDNTPPHFCTLICEGITILFPGSGRGLEVSAGFYLIENPWSMLTLMVPQGKRKGPFQQEANWATPQKKVTPHKRVHKQEQSQMEGMSNGTLLTAAPNATLNGKNKKAKNSVILRKIRSESFLVNTANLKLKEFGPPGLR